MKQSLIALLSVTLAAAASAAPDGQLDPTFGQGGLVKIDTSAQAGTDDFGYGAGGAVGPLGSHYALTNHYDGTSRKALVTRIGYYGAVDTSFGSSGTAVLKPNPASDFIAQDIAATPDGGAVVVGFYRVVDNPMDIHYKLALCKLTRDGLPDLNFPGPPNSFPGCSNAFSSKRALIPANDSVRGRLAAVAVRPNGSFVVASTFYENAVSRGAVWGLDANGNIDLAAFPGDSGAGDTEFLTPQLQIHDIALGPNGKIAIAADSTLPPPSTDIVSWIFYLAANGTATNNWTAATLNQPSGSKYVLSSVAFTSDSILAAGHTLSNTEKSGLFFRVRTLTGTVIGNAFTDANHVFSLCATCTDEIATDVTTLPDNIVLLAGTRANGDAGSEIFATRLVNYAKDTTFGTDGVTVVSFAAFGNVPGDTSGRIIIQKGKPVLFGTHGSDAEGGDILVHGLARLDSDVIFQDGFDLFDAVTF